MSYDKTNRRLFKMSELKDFEISPNNPDVRGWTLIGLDGERIGEVDELIVDTEAQKVRYLAVEVDKDVARGKDHHILVPIGAARLHKNDDNVLVEGLSRYSVSNYPMFDGLTITPEYEYKLRRAMGIDQDVTTSGPVEEAPLHPAEHTVSQARLDQMQAELQARRESQNEVVRDHTTRATTMQPLTSSVPTADTAPDQDSNKPFDQRSREDLEYAIRVALAERDVAIKERDIARAERDIMRTERDQALADKRGSSYKSEQFNEEKFYENRRNRNG
jgi:sporulation protein YlmC with PRC-barrel domain